jgi:hypothetical protein
MDWRQDALRARDNRPDEQRAVLANHRPSQLVPTYTIDCRIEDSEPPEEIGHPSLIWQKTSLICPI